MKAKIIGISIIITMFVLSFFYMIMFGQSATVYRSSTNIEILSLNMTSSNPDVIDAELLQTDDYTLTKVNSKKAGNSEVCLNFKIKAEPENFEFSVKYDFNVNHLGVISLDNQICGSEGFVISTIVSFIIITILMILELKNREKKTLYSHGNIATLTLIVFSIFIIIIGIFECVSNFFEIGHLNYFNSIDIFTFLDNFKDVPDIICFLLFPVVFITLIAISISNISLIRHEGKSIKNLLGAFLGFFILISTIAIFMGTEYIYSNIIHPLSLDGNNLIFALDVTVPLFLYSILSYFECLIISIGIYGAKTARHIPKYDKDYVIILGCAIAKDGSLLPLLRGRVDRAIQFAKEQEKLNGKKIKFVPSGGQGSDECISEGEAMKRYLISQGISEKYILAETNSKTTLENMTFSKKLIQEENPNAKIAFSTTNYHVFRSGLFSEEVGLHAEGMGQKTKWYFWPNAFARELIAMLFSKRKLHIFVIINILISSCVLGYIEYLFWYV